MGGEGEGAQGIDVHAQLEGREVEAGYNGEEAVEASEFVDEER